MTHTTIFRVASSLTILLCGLIWQPSAAAAEAPRAAYRDHNAHASGYRDSDRDGVEDFRDVCPRTLQAGAVDALGCLVLTDSQPRTERHRAAIRPLLTPAFALASAELTASIAATVNAVVEAVAKPPDAVHLVGYADSRGQAAANDQLSLQRALTVRDALVAAGWCANSISVRGAGEHDGESLHAGPTRREVKIDLILNAGDSAFEQGVERKACVSSTGVRRGIGQLAGEAAW